MSVSLDHIDLNSDIVSGDPEYDINKEGVADGETLTGFGNDGREDEEAVVTDEKVREIEEDTESKQGFESENESFYKGINLEEKIVTQETETGTETVCGEEGTCLVVGSSLGFEDSEKDENPFVCRRDADRVLAELSSHAIENDGIEIDDEEAKASEDEIEGTNIDNVGVLQGSDNDNGDMVNLVVDLEPHGAGEKDVNVKEADAKQEFSVSDLVWGKVRSHPWWPGQIFDPSEASKKATKYFKKGSYLIAYFGDQTFAWNEVSKIKPFQSHFSQMEKQSNLGEFHYALQCVLDEFSRRVEYGLACSCVPEYTETKTQIIVNAGIRGESCRRDGGDRFSNAASFEPLNLIDYIKELGQAPFGGVDRLEFVTARAQLLAFNRWKGYARLPEFQFLGTSLESNAKIPRLVEMEHGCEDWNQAVAHDSDDECVPSGKVKLECQGGSTRKRKRITGDSEFPSKEEKISLSKKVREKSLADMLAERRLFVSSVKSRSDGKATGKLNSSSSGKKRKAVDPISVDLVAKHRSNIFSSLDGSKSEQPKKIYRVGDSILRVASQLNGPTAMLKSVNGSQKPAVNYKSQVKSVSFKTEGKMLFPAEDSSPDEMMTQLCLVARNPMKRWNDLKSLIRLFVQFRNSFCLDHPSSQLVERSSPWNVSGGNIVKESIQSETETPESATIIASVPEAQSSLENQGEAVKCLVETPIKKGIPTIESQSGVQLGSNVNCDQETAVEIVKLQAGSVAHIENNDNDDSCPTTLMLSFTDLDSVPSETSLNKIFSRFGPLKESETEVLKKSKRAKLVFCKSADAEAAFSSTGKYSIFGPSLVSYRLKYVNSTPSESSPNTTKHVKKTATAVGENDA